jgi:hypothetical protein
MAAMCPVPSGPGLSWLFICKWNLVTTFSFEAGHQVPGRSTVKTTVKTLSERKQNRNAIAFQTFAKQSIERLAIDQRFNMV